VLWSIKTIKRGNNVARKGKPGKKETGWGSDDKTGEWMAKQRDKT
jgi:hypothetical protein